MAFYKRLPDPGIKGDGKAALCESGGGGNKGVDVVIPNDAIYMAFSVNNNAEEGYVKEDDIQIEIGSKSTKYDPYAGFYSEDVNVSQEASSGVEIVLMPGLVSGISTTMNLWCDRFNEFEVGDNSKPVRCLITVFGKASPPEVIGELTQEIEDIKNSIISLGFNV